MKLDKEVTPVVFRVYKKGGDVLALFPYMKWDTRGNCGSYQRIGQHGGAHYGHNIRATRPASPADYAPLARELRGMGYRLRIITRRGRK